MSLKAIDVYAGGGGLTVGLKRTGFKVVAAIENEEHAYATYRANHPEVHALKQDVTTVSGKDLLKLTGEKRIDLLAGCPPCQGFTSLTAKYGKDDHRNTLIFEMSRLAREIQPRAIMIENVPGLAKKGVLLYEELKRQLRELGYDLTDGILEVADYGVPQFRRRLVLLGGLGFEIRLPKPTHSKDGKNALVRWRTVKDSIGQMVDPVTLQDAKRRGEVQQSDWHVVRTLSPENVKRIKLAEAGKTWTSIPETLRPNCHQGGYNGFTNVYGRMEWDQPSPTITGGCTTFSKGRFGHPIKDRTISVREAALLQTFPESYWFDTLYMEHVCNVIGNALPCDFAEAISRQCQMELVASDKRKSNERRGDSHVDERVSLRMKRVKQRDTTPELVVRKLLFAKGYRYRIHRDDLPGSPDVVFPSRRKVVFVHGCFWHGHENCARASLPKSRTRYWADRIAKNRERDMRSISALEQLGWSVYVVWECETKNLSSLEQRLSCFLQEYDARFNKR